MSDTFRLQEAAEVAAEVEREQPVRVDLAVRIEGINVVVRRAGDVGEIAKLVPWRVIDQGRINCVAEAIHECCRKLSTDCLR